MITFNTENDGLKKDEQDEPEISVAETGSTMESINEAAEEEEKSKAVSQSDKKIEELVKEDFIKENRTKFHKGSLRNGVLLEYDGSIVLLGDVNAGAEIRATGNIIILGALKGVAHAGTAGETEAYIFALNMSPVQLRIADVITRFPENRISKSLKNPEYAYLEDGRVYVSAFE